MEFEFTPDQEGFRSEVRAFLDRTLTPEFWERHRREGHGSSSPEFSCAAGRAEMLAIAWPQRYGGQGKSFFEQMIYMEEMTLAGAPIEHHRRAVQQVGPAIMLFGSDSQKQSILPRIASGEISFAMGLSEPNAGSDLASAETCAVRSGDDWIVNGRKRFTSGAHFSDLLWTVVRTDLAAPKHRGLSILVVPLDAPGVAVRPLIDLQGRHHFNEVFLDDVRVSADSLVGGEGRGWYVNAAAMDFERSGIARYAFLRRTLDRALNDARIRKQGESVSNTSSRRERLADAAVRAQVGKLLSQRVAALQSVGDLPNYEVSIAKLTVTETIQQVTNTALNGCGVWGLLADPPTGDVENPSEMAWGSLYVDSVRHTIGQGAAEIQRNVIAQRGLGLPRA